MRLTTIKRKQLSADERYIASVIEDEHRTQAEVEALILTFWQNRKNYKKLSRDIQKLVEAFMKSYSKSLSETMDDRFFDGFLLGAFLMQSATEKYATVKRPGNTLDKKWHFGNKSYIDNINNYTYRLLSGVDTTLKRGMLTDIAPSISKPFKTLERAIKTMSDTELTYASRQGTLKAMGDEYIFIATLDNLTCEICGELDGQTFKTSEAVVGVNYPPIHPHCRCVPVPKVLDEYDRIAKDEKGVNITVKMDYSEWVRKYGFKA